MALINKEITPPAVNISSAEPASKFAKNFFLRRDEFLAGLSSADFYIQILFISIATCVAWLLAALIEQRVKKYLASHPPKRIDIEFFTKPLQLLAPLLILLFLSFIPPLTESLSIEGEWTKAAFVLAVSYFLAKCVLLLVHTRPVANFIAFVIMLLAVLHVSGFSSFTVAYLSAMSIEIGQFHITMLNLFHGVVILVVVFWIAGVLSRTLESYLRRSSSLSYTARELSVKFFRVFVYFIALIITLSSLGVDLTAFAVFGGALGVGIGLGLQKLTGNFVSGITLLLEKSIRLGDLIEVGTNTGWVRQLNIRYALIETADGREVMIPNEELVSTRVINWTHTSNTARVDIKINVAYNSNPNKVRELMLQAAKEYKLCLKDPAPSCWLREFGENALQFLLIFWIADVHDGRNGPQSDVMISILDKFRQAGIGIPCPAAENKALNLEI